MAANFIDSNVLLYLFDEVDGRKRNIAERLISDALATEDGVISFQVVQETLNVLSGKLASPARPEDAARFLDAVLAPLWRVTPSAALYHRALELRARYRYSFYDALVVAAALEAGCARLYSEDLQHGQQIDGLTIHNPFLT